MARKLKVFRTPIGFHDAYVAAPSQKAALKAWGADVDLFARGSAEIVTDDALTKEPLEHPGTIIRRLRGSDDEHFAALAEQKPRSTKTNPPEPEGPDQAKAPSRPKPKKPKSKPKPSRSKLTAAEENLDTLVANQEAERTELRQRERDLQKQRRLLDEKQERETAQLEATIEKERSAYEAALEDWRGAS
jgi:hypothetical protein